MLQIFEKNAVQSNPLGTGMTFPRRRLLAEGLTRLAESIFQAAENALATKDQQPRARKKDCFPKLLDS